MHSTSVYSLKLSFLGGAGGKALATDHRARRAKLVVGWCTCSVFTDLSKDDSDLTTALTNNTIAGVEQVF